MANDEKMAGTVVAERYELQELIGSGGMAVIYQVHHRPTNKVLAMKMLRSHMSTTPKYVQHLMQEAKALSLLSHPAIVSVADMGIAPSGQPYILLERIYGESLQQILDRDKRVDLNRALAIFAQACDALAHAGERQVFHGDLKPSHFLLFKDESGKECVKIIGFRVIGKNQAESTSKSIDSKTGEIYGCPPYMSPEQCRCKPLDERSDIYSLACVIYEVVTGKPPFLKDTPQATLLEQISAEPKPLQIGDDPEKIKRLQEVLFKAMAKEAGDRYQSMKEFKQALQSAAL